MFISDARFKVAEAQKARAEDLALGRRTTKAVQWQSSAGKPQTRGSKLAFLAALRKKKTSYQKNVRHAQLMFSKSCGPDAKRRCPGNVAGQGNLLACLTTARGVVSRPMQCGP